MEVILNEINGIPSAIEAMYFSKRTWTMELHNHIRSLCNNALTRQGKLNLNASPETLKEFNKLLSMVCNISKKHITLGKYIDFDFIVIGLHRGGQDDWDAHAERFDNRIIRSSTRLATFEDNEMSDYYKGKIIPTDQALKILQITSPNELIFDGKTYVKTVNGYILKEYENDKDVKRGLYMLSIPSNFIFKSDLTEFSHVYKERNETGTANPEVKLCAEKCLEEVNSFHQQFNRELMMAIKN